MGDYMTPFTESMANSEILDCSDVSNYFYNRLCQNYPRRFVPILRRNGATQTKTSFVCFVAHIKIEDHMFLVFWFVPSFSSYGPKRKGHLKSRIKKICSDCISAMFLQSCFKICETAQSFDKCRPIVKCFFCQECLQIKCLENYNCKLTRRFILDI